MQEKEIVSELLEACKVAQNCLRATSNKDRDVSYELGLLRGAINRAERIALEKNFAFCCINSDLQREPGTLNLKRVGELHDLLMRESALYREAHQLGLVGLMSQRMLAELEAPTLGSE